MPEPRERGVGEGVAIAAASGGIRAFEDAHFITEIVFRKCQHAADPWGQIRKIRFKGTGFQCFRKGFSLLQSLQNRIGLVAVGYDETVLIASLRRINDQARILHAGGVIRFRIEHAVPFGKYPVAAVGTSPHNEICRAGRFSVCGFSDDDSAADIAVAANPVGDWDSFVNVRHDFSFSFRIFSETSSAAAGRMFHSASRMTRFCKSSGVSPS